MKTVHAASYLASDTFCGIKLQWKDQKSFVKKSGRPIKVTKLRRELTCRRCDKASA